MHSALVPLLLNLPRSCLRCSLLLSNLFENFANLRSAYIAPSFYELKVEVGRYFPFVGSLPWVPTAKMMVEKSSLL